MPQHDTINRGEQSSESYPNGSADRAPKLPLIAIAGTAGKSSTGWMLVRILEQAGYEIGAWLSNGVYVDHVLRHDELHAWELATFAAKAKEIDVLVQEIPSVLANGLPANSLQSGIFTSICGSDGQCQRGRSARKEQEAIKTLATAVGAGRIVANADDLMIVDVVEANASNVAYYALNGANPVIREHVRLGGDACWVQNGWIKVQFNGTKQRLARVDRIPNTLGGHVLFQVQNALAAIAAALPIVGEDADLTTIFRQIEPDQRSVNAGLHVISETDRVIMADRPRTVLAVKQIARGIRAYGPRRVIVVLQDLGALEDAEAVEASRVLGTLAGIAVLVEFDERRDLVENIKRAMMSSDDPPAIVIRDGADVTLEHVRSLLEEGDVALILTDDPSAVVSQAAPAQPAITPG